jgi:hypothetical protein
MNVNEIVRQLRDERSKLDAAIEALEGVGGRGHAPGKRRGRLPGSSNKASTTSAVSSGAPKKRRTMSAAARKRIGDAVRARWAAAKRSGKKRL